MGKVIAVHKKIFASPFTIPGLLLFLLMVLLHLLFPIISDDVVFIGNFPNMGFIEHTVHLYNTWSSRVIINAFLWVLSHSWHLFLVLNIAVNLILYCFIVKVFCDKPSTKICWISMFLVLMYPFEHMANAGHMSTTVNYTWPLAFALIAGYGIKKSLVGEKKIRSHEAIIYTVSLIIAANVEQVNVILLGVLILLLGYRILIHKKLNYYLLVQLLIVLAMLIFIMMNPGNESRYISEMGRWFPDFAMFGIVERIQFGYVFLLSHFVFNPNLIFTVFCLLLYISVHLQHTDKLYRAVAAIPLGSSIMFGIGVGHIAPPIYRFAHLGQNPEQWINVFNFHLVNFYIPIIMLGIVILCILAALYLSFKDEKWKAWLYLAILLLGLGAGLVIGFTPTIWATGVRAFVFTYFAFISCAVLLYQKIYIDKFKYENWLFALLGFLGMSSYFRYLASLIV